VLLSCSKSYIQTRCKDIVATFTANVVRNWHRLPRDIMVSPYLAVLRTQLDNALSNLI